MRKGLGDAGGSRGARTWKGLGEFVKNRGGDLGKEQAYRFSTKRGPHGSWYVTDDVSRQREDSAAVNAGG